MSVTGFSYSLATSLLPIEPNEPGSFFLHELRTLLVEVVELLLRFVPLLFVDVFVSHLCGDLRYSFLPLVQLLGEFVFAETLGG